MTEQSRHEMPPAVETIQAFACEIAQMSEQALVRTNRHIAKLRKVRRIEKAAAIQADFLKEAMEHAEQHTRRYIEMLATFPHELVQPVNAAVVIAEAARHATAAKVERLAHKELKATASRAGGRVPPRQTKRAATARVFSFGG